MNIDNINKTIQRIKDDQSVSFYMGDYILNDAVIQGNHCGTACCLAGYATLAEFGTEANIPLNGRHYDGEGYVDHFEHAKAYFGIDENTADALFIPHIGHINNTNKEDAIKVLEALRDTGEVIWNEIPTTKHHFLDHY